MLVRHSKMPAKLTTLILLPLLLLCYGVGSVVHSATVHENSQDFHSLLEFKQGITKDPKGALNNWNPDTHFCRWNGVNCTLTRPLRVMRLNLTRQGLSGPISSSLRNLTFLVHLDLSYNNLVGPLPAIKGLQKLEKFFVNNNFLQGLDPDALTNCSMLASVDLNTNLLTGVIPSQVSFLPNLRYLDLSTNNLTGVIPRALENATTLETLRLASNQLEGSIPHEIWQLPNLVDLFLGGNGLSGRIPTAVFNQSSIETLSLETNMLGGTLPPNIGDIFPNLEELILMRNEFEGPIPISLGSASMLEKIDLSNNNFTGTIPISLGKLSRLRYLSLGQNKLEANDKQSWEFLHALNNCSLLQYLTLTDNKLRGAIPPSVGNLTTSLTTLQFSWNYISGSVPASIGNLSGLTQLGLSYNRFTGTIEEWIGNLKKLQGLYLHRNNFNGPITSVASLAQLNKLLLHYNDFDGSIPYSMGSLQQLTWLDLSNNNLQGNIPTQLGELKQLTDLRLSSSKLTGEIPDALGQCQNLEILRLDQNFLIGNIPISFGDLKSLKVLNLSHNTLSGEIPTTLKDLHLLDKLDLSYNHLQGKIPTDGVFTNATAVSLDGNLGLCGGVTDLHRPLCPTSSRRTQTQYFLIRVLIPIFGFLSLVLVIYTLFVVLKKPRRKLRLISYSIGDHFPKVSYQDLAQATRDFSESNLIGKGSSGTVYKGKLKDNEMEVAVKVFDLDMRGAERSFMLECEALRSIQHRNLLPIITVCSTVDNMGNVFKALLYEFMPNGNLDSWLHQKGDGKTSKSLGLTQRINIIVNIADALDYLHHDCGRPTVHCDLKPSNILLDEEMTALLGDFGIARFYSSSQLTSTGSVTSVGVKGTIGYIAPEYGGGGYHASTSGDVYSFGIVLLEMITGKRPTDPMFNDGLDIVSFVNNNFPNQISQVIDEHLTEECKTFSQANNTAPENAFSHCLASLLQIGLSCTRIMPSERMNMKEIASKLHEIRISYFGWKGKG